jgi:hypothetical protein
MENNLEEIMDTTSEHAQSNDNLTIIDDLSQALAQLDAQAQMVSAEGFAAFRGMSADVQQNYLWSMASAASKARDLCGRLCTG